MKNISIWKDSIDLKEYPKLNENKNVDVLIIGGGITGISTFYYLKKSGLKTILVEQNKIGLGITGSSTGKLSILQNDLIDKIRSSFNDETALKYINSQIDAINKIVKLILDLKIDCDLEKIPASLYTNNEFEIDRIKNLAAFLLKNNIRVEPSNLKIVKNKFAIKDDVSYVFNPLKFLNGILSKDDYEIYEKTSIIKIKREKNFYISYTDNYKIKSKFVVIASHYPYFLIPYFFPFKSALEKSYLSASTYNGQKLSLINYQKPFISIRTYKNYLIYLSNSHNISCKTCDYNHFQELLKKLEDIKLKPDYLWSNIDIITNDGMPYVGEIKKNLLIGTGYNTWGLTNGFLAGEILKDIILKNNNPYISLFAPKRFNLAQLKGYIGNICKNALGFLVGLKGKNNHYCSHMNCKLIFNKIEKTWDCPCHGSRFDINNNPISGPANKKSK